MAKKKKPPKRGYLIGLILGFQPMDTIFWKIYANRSQIHHKVKLNRKYKNADKSQRYHYFEEIVNHLRPLIHTGIKSVMLVSPEKKKYSQDFLTHINSHHQWLVKKDKKNSVSFREMFGNVADLESITKFIQKPQYIKLMGENLEEEGDKLILILEERLQKSNEGLILCTMKEIESVVYAGGTRKKKFKPLKLLPEYILLTSSFQEKNNQKPRLQRLLQIAQNRKIVHKVLDPESSAGMRVEEFGGIVCFMKINSEFERNFGDRLISS